MAAETARKSAEKISKKSDVETPEDVAWSGPRLMTVGFVSLMAALAVIVFLGSRFQGCFYLDGSRPGMAIGK